RGRERPPAGRAGADPGWWRRRRPGREFSHEPARRCARAQVPELVARGARPGARDLAHDPRDATHEPRQVRPGGPRSPQARDGLAGVEPRRLSGVVPGTVPRSSAAPPAPIAAHRTCGVPAAVLGAPRMDPFQPRAGDEFATET